MFIYLKLKHFCLAMSRCALQLTNQQWRFKRLCMYSLNISTAGAQCRDSCPSSFSPLSFSVSLYVYSFLFPFLFFILLFLRFYFCSPCKLMFLDFYIFFIVLAFFSFFFSFFIHSFFFLSFHSLLFFPLFLIFLLLVL